VAHQNFQAFEEENSRGQRVANNYNCIKTHLEMREVGNNESLIDCSGTTTFTTGHNHNTYLQQGKGDGRGSEGDDNNDAK
jgi:hypothetical protein